MTEELTKLDELVTDARNTMMHSAHEVLVNVGYPESVDKPRLGKKATPRAGATPAAVNIDHARSVICILGARGAAEALARHD
jgi:hypothetical protein